MTAPGAPRPAGAGPRLAVVLLTLAAVALVALVYDAGHGHGREGRPHALLSWRTPEGDAASSVPGSEGAATVLRDDDRAAAEVAAMVAAVEGPGLWDSHPDAILGHVAQPGLVERAYQDITVSTNRYGMRERDYALPKPAGTLRVVLLGDSFIFGLGVQAAQRLGVVLERELAARAGLPPEQLEVLHLGASSWSLLAECAFARRQLSLLQPDLLVHVSVANDLGDTMGARGFGALGRFAPAAPSQGDALVRTGHARWALDAAAISLLPRGWDEEGRARFARAGEELGRLARLVEQGGGRYLHLFHWGELTAAAAEQLAPRLEARQVAFLPSSFHQDLDYRLSAGDDHWNPAGHERVAQVLYGLIRRRGLLPDLELAAWPEVEPLAEALVRDGLAEANAGSETPRGVAARFVVGDLTARVASQVHGGIDREGRVQPLATLMLSCQGRTALRVVGAGLERPELSGLTVAVSVEGRPLARFQPTPGQAFEHLWTLPEDLRERLVINVRFQADDFAYTGADLRDTVSWSLERVVVEE